MIGLKQLASLIASTVVLVSSAFLVADDGGTVALKATPAGGTELVADGPATLLLEDLEVYELVTTRGVATPPAKLEGDLGEARLVAAVTGRPVIAELGGQTVTVRPGSTVTIDGLVGTLSIAGADLATRVSITGLAERLTVEPPEGIPVRTLAGSTQSVPVKGLTVDGVPVTGSYRNAGQFSEVRFVSTPAEGQGPSAPALQMGNGVFPFETEVGFALEEFVGVLVAVAIDSEHIMLSLDGFAYVELNGEPVGTDFHLSETIPIGVNGTINGRPMAAFSYLPAAPAAGDRVEFVDESRDDLFVSRWHWDFGDGGTSSAQHPTHRFTRGGLYTVTLTVWDAQGAAATEFKQVQVSKMRPMIEVGWSPRPVFEGKEITFWAKVDDVHEVVWTFSDGFQLPWGTASRAFDDHGLYNFTVVAHGNNGLKGYYNGSLEVLNAPPRADFVVLPAVPIAGEPAKLKSLATDVGSGSIVNHTWRVGGLTMPLHGPEPTVVFPRDGQVAVKLTVLDDDGETASKTRQITVANPPPTVTIQHPPYPNPGEAITFVAVVEDDDLPEEALWAFPGNVSKRGLAVPHVFTTGGTFPVTVSVTDEDGATGSATKIVRVNHPPSAEIKVSPAEAVFTGVEMTFTAEVLDLDGNATTLAWSVDGAPAGTAPSIERTWLDDGEHVIRLTATDTNGATSRVTKTVTVQNRPPNVNPRVLEPVINRGETATLDANATDPDGFITRVEWFLDDERIAVKDLTDPGQDQSVEVTFPSGGNVNLRAAATDDDGDTTSVPFTVQVNSPPTLSASVSPDREQAGRPILFEASATDPEGDGISYLWDFGDGHTDTSPVTSHTYATAPESGVSYEARITATDSKGASVSRLFSIRIDTPDLTAVLTHSPITPQAGSGTSFTVTIPPGRAIEGIDWNFGDGTTLTTGPGVASVTHTYHAPRTFDVTVQVRADHGSTASASDTVRVTGAINFKVRLAPKLPDGNCVNLDSPAVGIELKNGFTGALFNLNPGPQSFVRETACILSQDFPAGTWSIGDTMLLTARVGTAPTTGLFEYNGGGLLHVDPLTLQASALFANFTIHDRTNDLRLPGAPETDGSTFHDPSEPVFASGIVTWADGSLAKNIRVDLSATYRTPLQTEAVALPYASWFVNTRSDGTFETQVPAPLVSTGETVDVSVLFLPGRYQVQGQVRGGPGITPDIAIRNFIEDPLGILAILKENDLLPDDSF